MLLKMLTTLVAPHRRGMAEWHNGTMAVQQYGTMAEWQYSMQYGTIAEWQYSSMAQSQSSRMAEYGTIGRRMNGSTFI